MQDADYAKAIDALQQDMLGTIGALRDSTTAAHEILDSHNKRLGQVSDGLHSAFDSLTAMNKKLDEFLKKRGGVVNNIMWAVDGVLFVALIVRRALRK